MIGFNKDFEVKDRRDINLLSLTKQPIHHHGITVCSYPRKMASFGILGVTRMSTCFC